MDPSSELPSGRPQVAMSEEAAGESGSLATLRRALLAILTLGLVGTGAELLLLGHYEDMWQKVPLVSISLALIILVWHGFQPSAVTVAMLHGLGIALFAAGTVGIGLHFRGNLEFELEMYPTLAGASLVRQTMTGATPVLAPGAMIVSGLLAWAGVYHDPHRRQRDKSSAFSSRLKRSSQ